MPIKTSSGKWKWGNIERSSKKELVQTVYGIWKKNGSKGSFSEFWHGKHKTNESVEPKDKFFKVKKNGKEIGKYGLSFYDDIKAVGIGDLEVYPEFRNKGYGTKIIKDIVDRYKNDYDKIYCFVDKDNKDAIHLYKRLGKVSDEITYSQKIGDYEYKNTNGQHYVEFYNKLKESMITEDTKRYAYHCTEVDPEKIKKEGWKVGKGYTLDNHYEELYKKYLPKVPVFISDANAKVWDSDAKYCIKLDITGLDLYPDFGHLEDFDAYYDEDNESFYWEDGSNFGNNKKLKAFVREYSDEDTIAAEDFQGEDSFEVIGTACVDGTQLKGRIVEWKENKNAKKPEPEQPSPETQRIEASKIEQNNKKLAEMLKGKTILHTNSARYDSEELDFDYPDFKYFTKLDIPPSVKIIDLDWPFCERLTTLTVPGTVKEIRDAWITEADNLKSIVIEEGVEKLTHFCFYNNPALEEITLPDSLKVMQEDCFTDCPIKTVYCSEKIWNKYKKMFPKAVRKDKVTKESYEPPYTLDTIKQKYGVEAYRKLRNDPVHRFRAETGIEVIHKEPTRDEFERIVKNWDLMTPEQKKQSDEFSMKQFGKNNKDRIDNIRKEYLKEYWAKNGRYFYCYDCDKNMSKAPDDQYIMIDDDLWEYVCKHGGKKIGTEEDLCRDCIEKRLGRPLTLKDLGDKINLPINDEIKKMLKKRKMNESEMKLDLSKVPEDSMLDLTEIVEYKGPGFKEYSYLDNCIGGEGTLFGDASEMASWIYNFCQVIPISKVKDRLVRAPSKLTDAIEKLEKAGKINDLDEIVCAIDAVKQGFHEPEEMMFIYVSDQDIHYFFECSGALSESINEAHEIHSYPEKLQPIIERIVKDNEDYELNHAYFNKEGKFIWMRNLKGYFHVFKPVKFVKTPGMTKPFGFKDLILKDNGMLEEVDRLRFADGNEGLKFLKDKYHLELKTIK